MSSDFGFWKHVPGDPGTIFDSLAEGGSTQLVFSDDVVEFRTTLLSQWPDLADVLEPSEFDLMETPEDVGKYVLLALPVKYLDLIPELIAHAKRSGLVGYSGVADEAI